MAEQIQLRRDTATNWINENPILAVGEIGIETDTDDKLKVGDGTTAWSSLLYFAPGGLTQYGQTVIVAKSGGNYNNINDALTSITDASVNKKYMIFVYPGTYVEQVTMKDYVDIIGVEADGCTISYTDTVITMGNTTSDLINMGVEMTLAPAVANTDTIVVTDGTHSIRDCLMVTTRSSGGYLVGSVNHTGGALDITNTTVQQFLIGTSAGGLHQKVIIHGGTGTMRLNGTTILANMDATSIDDLHVIHINAGTTGTLIASNSFMNGVHLGTGELIGMHIQSSGAIISNCAFTFVGQGTVYGASLDGTSVTMDSYNNILNLVSTGGTTYTGNIDATCTWNSYFDVAETDERATGAGTANVATSFAPGTLTVSNYVAMPTGGIFTDGTYGYTIAQGYGAYAHSQINPGNPHGVTVSANLVPTPASGTVDHGDNVEKIINHMWSAGPINGFELTDNGDGSVSVASGTVMLRETAESDGTLFATTVLSGTPSLVDDATNLIYIDYNSGSPTISATLDAPGVDGWYQVPVATVTRNGNDTHEVDLREYNTDYIKRNSRTDFFVRGFEHAPGGTVLTETGTRNIAVTEGTFFIVSKELPHPAYDTSSTDSFDYMYTTDAGSTWQKTGGNTQINNAQYNDINSGLVSMTEGYYMCQYTCIIFDNGDPVIYILYGQEEHASLSQAQSESLPTVRPPDLATGANFAFIGKIIIQKDASTFADIQSPFAALLGSQLAASHNDLAGLQGGTSGEYYHTTETQFNALTGTNGTPGGSNAYVTDTDPRNTNSRNPNLHASSHLSGGADVIALDELGDPSDNTNLNATSGYHGLLPKLSNLSGEFLDGTGDFREPPQSTYGSEFQTAIDETQSSTTSTTFQQKLRMTTTDLPAGTYRLGWTFTCWNSNTADRVEVQVEQDDTTVVGYHFHEPKDVLDRIARSSFNYLSLDGIHTFDVDYRQQAGSTAYIEKVRLELWRVS